MIQNIEKGVDGLVLITKQPITLEQLNSQLDQATKMQADNLLRLQADSERQGQQDQERVDNLKALIAQAK